MRLSGSSRKSLSTYLLLTCTAITTYPTAKLFQEFFQFISGLNSSGEVYFAGSEPTRVKLMGNFITGGAMKKRRIEILAFEKERIIRRSATIKCSVCGWTGEPLTTAEAAAPAPGNGPEQLSLAQPGQGAGEEDTQLQRLGQNSVE